MKSFTPSSTNPLTRVFYLFFLRFRENFITIITGTSEMRITVEVRGDEVGTLHYFRYLLPFSPQMTF